MKTEERERIEFELLLDALQKCSGYDFHHYAQASLRRRVYQAMLQADVPRIVDLLPLLLYEDAFLQNFLFQLSVTVTEMFRDPQFFLALRSRVIPMLRTYPFLKVWHAGCATGEEVYSLAMLLQEEELYQRTLVYATDINPHSLETASEGIYPAENLQKFTRNYQQAGGVRSFSDYYEAHYRSARMNPSLKERVTFAQHNLATDSSFGEMNLIICRNVLIYFDRDLQDRVFKLFCDSLAPFGYLCLGTKETLDFSSVRNNFEVVDKTQRIYRKVSEAGGDQ